VVSHAIMTSTDSDSLDFNSIRKKLLASRKLFVDPEFPPDIRSISPSGRLPRDSKITRIIWKRPGVSTNCWTSKKFIFYTNYWLSILETLLICESEDLHNVFRIKESNIKSKLRMLVLHAYTAVVVMINL